MSGIPPPPRKTAPPGKSSPASPVGKNGQGEFSSYQYAPSTMEGWNDCPLDLPKARGNGGSSSRSGSRSGSRSSSRSYRVPSYPSFMDGGSLQSHRNPGVNVGANASSTSLASSSSSTTPTPGQSGTAAASVPLPPPSRNASSPNLQAQSREEEQLLKEVDVEQEMKDLLARPTTLPPREFEYYRAKLSDPSVFRSRDNQVFLATLFKELKSGGDGDGDGNGNGNGDALIVEFMRNRVGVTWCVSLRKVIGSLA